MIKSLFYSKFHPREGPKVQHQVPSGSITPQPGSPPPLIDFDSLVTFLIPRQEFCDQPISINVPSYRVLGYPVCVANRKYERNEYIFNFAIVLDVHADASGYAAVVRKLAMLFRALEEQGEWLSRAGEAENEGKVYAVCEMILEDLNNYCECMIPIDDSNTINIKLFPSYPPPAPIKPHHVPLPTISLTTVADKNWDLTMLTILPYIDGINSVSRIAQLADASPRLVRAALEHLLYYSCVLLLDVWSFSNTYAATPEILLFISNAAMQAECAAYVASQGPFGARIDTERLLPLYLSLRQGLSVKNWVLENKERLDGVDVRRFVTFGVVKGFLYRVHKYTIWKGRAAKTLGAAANEAGVGEGARLERFLDGTHCFDEICTALECSERELMAKLKRVGTVQIIHR